MDCTTPGLLVFHYFLEFAQIHANCVDASIQPSHSLCPLLHLPSIFPSISVFSNDSALRIRWPKYWSFSFSISPSSGYSGLISWFPLGFPLELTAIQGTLKNLLQHNNSKASILWHSAFFWANSHTHAWLLANHNFDYMDLCWQSNVSAF